jgi:hypothetical protein
MKFEANGKKATFNPWLSTLQSLGRTAKNVGNIGYTVAGIVNSQSGVLVLKTQDYLEEQSQVALQSVNETAETWASEAAEYVSENHGNEVKFPVEKVKKVVVSSPSPAAPVVPVAPAPASSVAEAPVVEAVASNLIVAGVNYRSKTVV